MSKEEKHEEKRMVSAKCFIQVFDNAAGILYYPGDVEESLNLDSDAALCFELTPVDRKYAMEARDKRVMARKKLQKEMKDAGFENIYQYKAFRKMEAEAKESVQ